MTEAETASAVLSGVAAEFWANGYHIFRGMFSAEEIAALREAAYRSREEPEDLLCRPGLRWIVLDDRLLDGAREILGGTPVYFGDSTANVGAATAHFHKDCGDREDPNAPDWRGRYPIIRFGIYLQDHRRTSGGLDLRAGSHNTISLTAGAHVYCDTAPGDVVVWNLRTSHSGGALIPRWSRRSLDPDRPLTRLLHRFPLGLVARPKCERVAIFISYGLEGAHLRRFLAYLRSREYAVERWRSSPYDASVWEAARGRPLTVLDMHADVTANPPTRVNRAHVEQPY